MIGAKAGRHREGRRPPALQGSHAQDRPRSAAVRRRPHHGGSPRRSRRKSAPFRSSSAPPSPSAAPAAASLIIRKNLKPSSPAASIFRPVNEVLIEESLLGWKEFEMEVMRDKADNCVDHLLHRKPRPHGRPHRRLHHRGAHPDADGPRISDHARRLASPASARSAWRPAARTSSSPCNPKTGRMIVIEMNPRVSRSSRSGIEGHRISHCENRGQTGGRLHAG